MGEGWGEGLAGRNQDHSLPVFSGFTGRGEGVERENHESVNLAVDPHPQPSPMGRGSYVQILGTKSVGGF